MLKIATLFAIATTFIFLLTSRPLPKRTYHSLFISPSLSDNASISHHLHSLTRHPHIAGSAANAAAAVHVLSAFSAAGIPSRIVSYKASLTYPVSRTLTLTPSPSDPAIEFSLRQENVGENPYADEAVPTFHAYAKSGAAAGPVVYANFGRVEDFAALIEIGVNVAGTIVLARYGEIYRGDIVRNAYVAGAVGVVVYTDKKDYGGKRWFPEERWMPPSGVQVGTLYNGLGDPTTPGWASTMEECERISEEEIEMGGEVPLIPSLPVSGADAEVILRSLGGHVARDDWQGGEGGGSLVYKVGPGPGILNLDYIGKQVIEEIQNVIGVIEGAEEPDRFVILGNHRDAWTFGAVDPNSGTAALIEVAERLGKLQKSGWKPRRTILLCNWDAEEYGLIGSTEWVEENREMLASRAVAYLNVDCAVSEPRFYASATPQLDELLIQATKQVPHPDNSSQTVYEAWLDSSDPVKFGRLGGGGSDFAAFVQHIGIPAAAMSFDNGYPVYHSLYDDFTWMKKFGDPMFQRHVAVASVWGLVALWLADAEVLPFNYLSYAEELRKYAKEVENEISGKEDVSLSPLFKSIEELTKAATKINNQREEVKQDKGWLSMWKKDQSKVRELNDRLMMAERAFTDRDGLLGRSWYKHLIYGPSKYNDYGSKSFPGIDDAIEVAKKLNTEESWKLVQHEIWRVSRAVKQASQVLGSVVT